VQAICHKSRIIASIDTLFPREVFASSKLHPSSTLRASHRTLPHVRTITLFCLCRSQGENLPLCRHRSARNRREYPELLSNAPFPGNPLAPAGFAGWEDARERIDCTRGRDFSGIRVQVRNEASTRDACTPDAYFTRLCVF